MSIKEWYYMQSNKNKYIEDGEIQGGRDAERYVEFVVKNRFSFKNAYCFIQKRVPHEHGRKEIDLIVVTPKMIHITEVKNWSGQVDGTPNSDKWQYISRKGIADWRENPLKLNQTKMHILKGYLEKNKCRLPENPLRYFSQKVIFVNDKILLDSAIRSHPNVIMAKNLNGYDSIILGNP